MAKIKLIAGLGNPGQEYEYTRHNVGFWALDAIAQQFNTLFTSVKKFSAEVAEISFNGIKIILIKPNTFVNLSGQAIGAIAKYFSIQSTEILVIHDEMDLAPGRLKLKKGGGHGGHNGIKDIDAKLGSQDYYRLRIGIGHPKDLIPMAIQANSHLNLFDKRREVSRYVLKKPSIQDQEKIEHSIEKILDHLDLVLNMNLEAVQRQLHTL